MNSGWQVDGSVVIHSLVAMIRAPQAKFSPGGGGYFSISMALHLCYTRYEVWLSIFNKVC